MENFKGDPEVLEFIQGCMERMQDYVNAVYMQQVSIPIVMARYEGEEQRWRIEEYDKSRRYAHDSAIAAVAQLNRLAGSVSVEPMFKGDPDDRYEVADFCEKAVTEFFDAGQAARVA